jgi:hypothetical protein
MNDLKIPGNWKAIPWGETIQIRDSEHDEVCIINRFGDADKGIPSDRDRKISKLIENAPELLQMLKEATVRIAFLELMCEEKTWKKDAECTALINKAEDKSHLNSTEA